MGLSLGMEWKDNLQSIDDIYASLSYFIQGKGVLFYHSEIAVFKTMLMI